MMAKLAILDNTESYWTSFRYFLYVEFEYCLMTILLCLSSSKYNIQSFIVGSDSKDTL